VWDFGTIEGTGRASAMSFSKALMTYGGSNAHANVVLRYPITDLSPLYFRAAWRYLLGWNQSPPASAAVTLRVPGSGSSAWQPCFFACRVQ